MITNHPTPEWQARKDVSWFEYLANTALAQLMKDPSNARLKEEAEDLSRSAAAAKCKLEELMMKKLTEGVRTFSKEINVQADRLSNIATNIRLRMSKIEELLQEAEREIMPKADGVQAEVDRALSGTGLPKPVEIEKDHLWQPTFDGRIHTIKIDGPPYSWTLKEGNDRNLICASEDVRLPVLSFSADFVLRVNGVVVPQQFVMLMFQSLKKGFEG